jgi:hypothetical protein
VNFLRAGINNPHTRRARVQIIAGLADSILGIIIRAYHSHHEFPDQVDGISRERLRLVLNPRNLGFEITRPISDPKPTVAGLKPSIRYCRRSAGLPALRRRLT